MKRLMLAVGVFVTQSALAAVTAPVSSAHDIDAAWETAVDAFAAEDNLHAPPPGGVVFVGSSSIRLWNALEQEFRETPVVKRGFGGSRLSDCVHYLDRLVIRYSPKLVMVYAGDNDLAEGGTPADVLHRFEAFAGGVHKALPDTRIAFISVKPSPARVKLISQAREANELVRSYTNGKPWLDFVDVFTPMLGPDGMPRRELFRADSLHLNEAGYAIWKAAIKPHLQ